LLLSHLAEIQGDRRDLVAAQALLKRAIDLQRIALKFHPRHAGERYQLASELARLRSARARLGDSTAANEAFIESAAIFEQLASDFPKTPSYRSELASTLNQLADHRSAHGRQEDARSSYRKVLAVREQLINERPLSPGYLRVLAWFLVTCPDRSICSGDRAVKLGERAFELAPRGGDGWRTVGAARCRAGDSQGAIAALETALQFRGGGDSREWLFFAMAHAQQGQRAQTRAWYEKSVRWLEQECVLEHENLRAVRTEVESLLDGAPKTIDR
jgi:tetratricopeptide (TPR) repeat protein